MTMRLHWVLALGVLSLAACGSSTNSSPAGQGGSNGFVSPGGSGGRGGSTGFLGSLADSAIADSAIGAGGAVAIDGAVAVDSSGATGGVAAGGVSGSKGGATGSTGGTAGAAGGTSGTGGARNQSCGWLADCLSASNCADDACVTACTSQASAAAISQYTAIINCVAAQPACTTSECIAQLCASEVAACAGVAPVDAGTPGLPDAGVTTGDVRIVRDTGSVSDAIPSNDADADGSGGGQGYTTAGSCETVTKIPGMADSHTCWDYTLTVTTNHNDGTEHYVAYAALDVDGTKSACTSQSYSATQAGPWNSASISASNLSHKQQACTLAGSSYGTTTTWTEGGSCTLAGSLGHCTDAATNAWDPSTTMLSASLVGVWSVP